MSMIRATTRVLSSSSRTGVAKKAFPNVEVMLSAPIALCQKAFVLNMAEANVFVDPCRDKGFVIVNALELSLWYAIAVLPCFPRYFARTRDHLRISCGQQLARFNK